MIKFIMLIAVLFVSTPAIAAQIDIDSHSHTLSYTDDNGKTKSYQIAVGKQGTDVHGTFTVERKKLFPSWTPTPHMLHGKRAHTVKPGPKNPLGVAKLYLSGPQKYIGIHGTNDESSIGKDVSHGCFRLHKADILELYHSVPVKTKVIVK